MAAAKKPKSLVGPLRASDTRLRRAKVEAKEPNANAKPKVFVVRCGTANQLGPAKEFTTDAAAKAAAVAFFKEAIPWAQRHENAAVKRIAEACDAVGALPEMVKTNHAHRVGCVVDSYTGLERVVELKKITAPPKPTQQTLIK